MESEKGKNSPMKKEIFYNAAEHIDPSTAQDPFHRPTFLLGERLHRLTWIVVYSLLYRHSPRPMHAWRARLLRLFGAKMGENCHFYPEAKIWAPWNLQCEDSVTAADGAELYNPAPLKIDSHAIVSQGAYICGATHDFNDPAFPYLAYPMELGRYSWICARAIVGPGVKVGEGAVLALGAVAVKDLEPWSVYGGNPAQKIKERKVVA